MNALANRQTAELVLGNTFVDKFQEGHIVLASRDTSGCDMQGARLVGGAEFMHRPKPSNLDRCHVALVDACSQNSIQITNVYFDREIRTVGEGKKNGNNRRTRVGFLGSKSVGVDTEVLVLILIIIFGIYRRVF